MTAPAPAFRFGFLVAAAFAAACMCAAPPAFAAEGNGQSAEQGTVESLDTLFDELKASESEGEAKGIEQKIWSAWNHSGSATIDLFMSRAGDAMGAKDYGVAMQLLDTVIELKPDYAEGWNRRATLHYVMKNYGESIGDIQHTLALEPRHFGALADLGLVFRDLGDKPRALKAFREALALNPHMKKIQEAADKLIPEVDGREL
ncbi:MAG: tetratricopeptide repeat protein [Hyphomicrobiales bacterium]|nr:tetratricopeptide repeat protein [Hyphomicrobiales bacterium]